MTDILGIGNALVDALVQVDNELIISELNLQKGAMQLIDTERYLQVQHRMANMHPKRTTGGSACNTLLAVAQMGGHAGVIGNVGRDDPGQFFSNSFKALGVDTLLSYDDDLPTGVASTFITPDGQRTFGTYLGAAANLKPDKLQAEWFDGYRYFYIEGYLVQNQQLLRRAVELAKEAGCYISIDLASYNVVESNEAFLHDIVENYVNIVFANESEAEAFTHKQPREAANEIAKICDIAVVKVGKDGSMICTGQEFHYINAREAKAIDATGAGDLYAAGFLYGHSLGLPLNVCGEIGAIISAKVVEVIGPKIDIPRWKDAKQQIRELISAY